MTDSTENEPTIESSDDNVAVNRSTQNSPSDQIDIKNEATSAAISKIATIEEGDQRPPLPSSTMRTVYDYSSHLYSSTDNDYPTDEKTLSTLNSIPSLSEYNKFGMDVAPVEMGEKGELMEVNQRGSLCLNDLPKETANTVTTTNTATATSIEAADELRQNSNSPLSTSSTQNNVQLKKDRPDKLHILEMARKRMSLALSPGRKSDSGSNSSNGEGSGNSSPDRSASSNSGSNSSKSSPETVLNGIVKSSPTEDDSFLNNAIVENVSHAAPSPPTAAASAVASDDSLSNYNLYGSAMSHSTITTSSSKHSNQLYGISRHFSGNNFVNASGDYGTYASPTTLHKTAGSSLDAVSPNTQATGSTVVASGSRPMPDSSGSGTTSSGGATSSGTVNNSSNETTSSNTTSSSESNKPFTYQSITQHLNKPSVVQQTLESQSLTSTVFDEHILNESYLAVKNLAETNSALDAALPRQLEIGQAADIAPVRSHTPSVSNPAMTTAAATAATTAATITSNNNTNSTTSTYSYNRAFLSSNITTSQLPSLSTTDDHSENPFVHNLPEDYSFCPSKTSNISTLTGEFVYDVGRMTGADGLCVVEERVQQNEESLHEGPVDVDTNALYQETTDGGMQSKENQLVDVDFHTGPVDVDTNESYQVALQSTPVSPLKSPLNRSASGPVDIDTNTILPMSTQHSSSSDTASLARPPPPPPISQNSQWILSYGSSEHLSSIIQYPSDGNSVPQSNSLGLGYVDEEAAVRYATTQRTRRGWCMVKLLVLVAVVLLAVSLASVTFGIVRQKEETTGTLVGRPVGTENDGSDLFPAVPELILMVPTLEPSFSPMVVPTMDAVPSVSIDDIVSELSTEVPSMGVSESPSLSPVVEVPVPVESIDEVTDAPTKKPTLSPSTKPTSVPTNRPTSKPTSLSTANPTPPPTTSPTPSPSTSPILPTSNPTIASTDAVEFITDKIAKIKASRDTYIKSTSSNWNYGNSNFLRVDRDPRSVVVIAFEIDSSNSLLQPSKRYDSSLENQSHRNLATSSQTMRVKEAKLRLYTLEASSRGGILYALPDSNVWDESILTWDNARTEVSASGEIPLGTLDDNVTESKWYTIDVTGAFDCCVESMGMMYVNLLIKSDSSDGVTYASREYKEGRFAPELVLTYSME